MDSNLFLIILLLIIGLLLPFLIFLMRNLNAILPYLYLNARIRAKEARLLKQDMFEDMIQAGSVPEIASMLENSEYGLAMQGLVLDSAESIEELLTRQTADIYCEIAAMLPERAERALVFLKRQWDIRNIKTVMRAVRKGVSADDTMKRIVPFGEIDMEQLRKMAESQTMEDLLTLFEGTFYEELSRMFPAVEQAGSLLPLEAALDKLLLEDLWKAVTGDRNLLDLRPHCAARIDAVNLNMLFRAKRDSILLDDIKPYLVAGGELPPAVVGAYDEVDDIGALIAELEGSVFYKGLMDALPEYETTGSLYHLEKKLVETVLAVGRDSAIKQPYGIAPVLGFLSAKETEVRAIRAVSRAKEAGLAPETIRECLVGM